jgi:hypothetical protein
MSPGTHVRIKPDWLHAYGLPDASLHGVVTGLSPSGAIIRVEMGELGHVYVCAAHVESLPTDNWHLGDRHRFARPEAAELVA